ncbi:hypothetical protein [Nonomuraea sediminis]|uniref:hypothetical protein n=1 Tax=Nonomuraea sediminis TaxID=2835864 RepID=UPI001BDD5DC9|nr:hypothetical protein [Nonomuraea sediminis]
MTLPSLALVNGLLAMIRASVPVTLAIYWAQAPPDAAMPYVVIYPDAGIKSPFERDLLNGGPTDLRYQVTAVGGSPDQTAWAHDKVSAVLLSGVPTVAGRRVWPAIQEGSQPVRRDDTSTPVWLATSQWLSRSD